MAKVFDEGKIDFVGKVSMMFWISNIAVIVSLILIFVKGINYGIDFKGGTEVQVKFAQNPDVSTLRSAIDKLGFGGAQIQSLGDGNEVILRFETAKGSDESETNRLQTERLSKVQQAVSTEFASLTPEIRRVDSVGPQMGDQMKRNGLLAVFYSLLAILIYIGLRFDYNFAPGAVLCLFHDVIIVLGIWALLGREFNVQILAAILTIIGYDINDTIVVYDRIRENIGLYKGVPLKSVINRSTNETLARTLATSTATLIACLTFVIFAGGVLADIGLTLILGIVFGTYSSIYVAAPLIIYFDKVRGGKAVA